MNSTTTEQSLILHTNGPIDPASWELFGVSAKITDAAIGQFGSGFSIAVAGLLRLGHAISIYSEGKEYHFSVEEMDFRGKEFKRVVCNGQKLGFTTHMGAHWPVDAFYRELVSNCMDESGIWFVGEGPLEGGTSIVVTGPNILQSHAKHNDIFVGDRESIGGDTHVRMYEGSGTIFYRGVKVGALPHASFCYEVMDKTALTEDRSLANEYDVISKIMCMLTKLEDKALIRRVLTVPKGKWEKEDCRDYEWTWSDAFSEVVKEIWETNPTALPKRVVKQVRQKLPDVEFKAIESSDFESAIQKAKEFLTLAGYPVTADIKVVENTDNNLIAFAHNAQIHLTERAMEKGLFDLVCTLFEENSHIVGHDDCTRSFQNYLIQQLITAHRKRLKVAL